MAGVGAPKSFKQILLSSSWMIFGAFLAAYSLEVFLIPNNIIDGGVVGVAILLSKALGAQWLYPIVLILNIPFIILAYKNIAKSFVLQMLVSVIAFVLFGHWIGHSPYAVFGHYRGDLLEIVVVGGLLLGLGVGLIIRNGGCLDGTEILGLLFNRKYGITVGSIVLVVNSVIFTSAGFVFGDWHSPIQSLITFFIVIKIMDMVIVGLDEMKSVMIFSDKTREISDDLMHGLGLGLTIINGRGGYTGEKREIIYLIAERLQLSEIKNLVQAKDPSAFIAIENLHEIATTSTICRVTKKPNNNHS